MSRLFILFVVFGLCGVRAASAHVDSALQRALNMYAVLGTEYWIAIPPNEINPYPTDELEVYVTSPFDTDIHVHEPARASSYRRTIKANEILTLSEARGETNWTWEVRNAEYPTKSAIRISSKHPIAVYVLNSKRFSTDGYIAIPTRAWGKEYVAASYYDFGEEKRWAGGFIVIARENATQVTIHLRGTSTPNAKTSGGKSIGDSISVMLDEGDVYMVKGDGQTRGVFDLTGSHITASKTIGLIGFHERTTMPNLLVNGDGRNHLCEMIPPVSAWSKSYSTVQFRRGTTGALGKGDVFRVIAAEPFTVWRLKYYDMETKALLGQGGGVLSKAGDFADLTQAREPTTIVRGYSVWEADKPILVVQYSTSSSWDGDPILDPFMVALQPTDRFAQHSVIQTPTTRKFTNHRITLIVQTDVNDPNLVQNLQSLTLDGVPVFNHPGTVRSPLTSNRMANNLYWAIIDVGTDSSAHTITGNGKVRFAGHLHGYGNGDAYGVPITGLASVHPALDTVPPTIVVQSPLLGGVGPMTALEIDSGATGIAAMTLDSAQSFNITFSRADSLEPGTNVVRASVATLRVVDCVREARAVVFTLDWAGNYRVDTVHYTPDPSEDRNAPVIRPISETQWIWGRLVTDSVNGRVNRDTCNLPMTQRDRGIRSISAEPSELVNMLLSVTTKLSTDSLTPTFTARYNVWVNDRAKNGSAIVSATDWAGNTTRDTVTYLAPVSVLDAEEGASPIRVFREGTNTILRSDAAPMTSVSILDLRGRLVVSAQPGSDTWSGTLPTGVYIAIIVVDGRMFRLPLAAF